MGERAKIIFDRSLKAIAREFNVGGNVVKVSMPVDLHTEFVSLYRRAIVLCDKISAIIEDGEHRLALEEWSKDYDLPEPDFIKIETERLKATLRGFDAFRIEKESDSHVFITATQAQNFFNTFSQTYDVVHSLFDMMRNTDYFRLMRYLRDVEHIPYAGPSSLKEIVQVYFSLARAHKNQKAYINELMDRHAEALERRVKNALNKGADPFTVLSQAEASHTQIVPAPL